MHLSFLVLLKARHDEDTKIKTLPLQTESYTILLLFSFHTGKACVSRGIYDTVIQTVTKGCSVSLLVSS